LRRFLPVLLGCLLILQTVSCSFDYEEARMAEDLSEEVPETVLINFEIVRMDGGDPEYSVSGSRASAYGKKMETVLEDVLFHEFDKEGTVRTEGKAENIRFFTETEDAEISGDIRFYQTEEKTEIRADALSWKNEERILRGGEGSTVTVTRKSGSVMTGRGFRADIRKKRAEFTEGASGTWVEEEKDDEDGE